MTLNHRRVGGGPPLVLLHGIGLCSRVWEPVLDRLAEEREVLVVDLPGFGESAALQQRPTATALARSVIGLFDEIGWEAPAVCGNSLGGLIALEIADLGRAESVVAISPGGAAEGWERTYAKAVLHLLRGSARLAGPILEHLSRSGAGRMLLLGSTMARPQRAEPEWAAHIAQTYGRTAGFTDTMRALDLPSAYRRYRWLDVPVRIAWGTRDLILLPRQAERYAEVLPNAEMVRLQGLGHTPMGDDPDLVAQVILDAAQTPASSA